MGLLSAIKSVASKAVSAVSSVVKAVASVAAPKAVSAPAVPKAAAVSAPVKAVAAVTSTRFFPAVGISGVSTAIRLVTEPAKEIGRAITETVIGAAVAMPSAALAVATKLIPKSLLGRVGLGVVAVPAAVAVVSHPSSVGKAATGIVNVEGNLIKVAAEPSVENVKELFTENPILVGGAVAGAAIFGVKAAIPAITGLLTSERVEEQTAAIREQTEVIKDVGAGTTALVPEKALKTNEEVPVTTATTTIQTGKRRYRKAKTKEKPTSMKQSMQVLINNQNQRVNKNYIKRELLYN